MFIRSYTLKSGSKLNDFSCFITFSIAAQLLSGSNKFNYTLRNVCFS